MRGVAGNFPPCVGHGVADHAVLHRSRVAEEDTAVPGVENVPVAEVAGPGPAEGGGGGDEAGEAMRVVATIVEEAQQGRPPVERAVEAGECGVAEFAPQTLADGGGADEAPGGVLREAQEDLAHGVVIQRRRLLAAAASQPRQRGHGERIGLALRRRIRLVFGKRFPSSDLGRGARRHGVVEFIRAGIFSREIRGKFFFREDLPLPRTASLELTVFCPLSLSRTSGARSRPAIATAAADTEYRRRIRPPEASKGGLLHLRTPSFVSSPEVWRPDSPNPSVWIS